MPGKISHNHIDNGSSSMALITIKETKLFRNEVLAGANPEVFRMGAGVDPHVPDVELLPLPAPRTGALYEA